MTPHEVLGVREGATITEIKKAWRPRLLEVHPDVGGTAEATHRVQLAYEQLCADPDQIAQPRAERATGAQRQRPATPASSEDIERLIRDLDEEIAKHNRWMERMLKQEQAHRRMMARQQCIATTKKGYPCQSWPKGDGLYCAVHDRPSSEPDLATWQYSSGGATEPSAGCAWQFGFVMMALVFGVLLVLYREVALETLPLALLLLSPFGVMALIERARSKSSAERLPERPDRSQR